jgi:hypothetical protein
MKGNRMDQDPKPKITPTGERIIAATTESGEVMLEGVTYPYRVCDPEKMGSAPKLFVGFGEHTGRKELFISANVDPRFRTYVFLHEVNCLSHVGEPHHCSNAEKHVLEHVPHPDKLNYIDLRKEMFTNLIAYLEKLPKPPEAFIRETRETLEFLQSV